MAEIEGLGGRVGPTEAESRLATAAGFSTIAERDPAGKAALEPFLFSAAGRAALADWRRRRDAAEALGEPDAVERELLTLLRGDEPLEPEPEAVQPPDARRPVRQAAGGDGADPAEQAPADPAGPPAGYRVRPDGVYRLVETGGGREWRWLCSPLSVLALPRDAAGGGWGRLVEVMDPDGRRHRWAIPARLFAGDGGEVIGGLLDLGLHLAPGRAAREAVLHLLLGWRPPARALAVDRSGWTADGRAFVLPSGRVLGDATDVVLLTEAPAVSGLAEAGAVDDWRAGVAALCVGNPLLVVAVSAAFAGPLLEPLGLDGGGLHFRGGSSTGKTTLLRAAASVWGGPSFLRTWRATANGLEAVAAAHSGLLLALDEIGEVSPREAGAAAYMLGNGAGKARAARTGAARPAARWRVMLLSSGELTLADRMAEAGGRAAAGQEIRLLDIPADARPRGVFDVPHGAADGATFADRLKAAASRTFGTAGPAFVARVIADRDHAVGQAGAAIRGFVALARERFGLGADGQSLRAAGRLGLIAAAGELATCWGLTGWPAGAARDAALEVLQLWLAARGGAGPAEAREAVVRTRAFLVAHGESRFEVIGGADRPIVNRAGWRDGNGCFFIAADAWREIHRGADPARAARHVRDAGFLLPGDGKNLAVRAPREVPGRPRVYAVRSDILGAEDA